MLSIMLVAAFSMQPVVVPTQPTSYDFAVIGDTQSVNKGVLWRAVRGMRKRKLRFVAHVGDIDWCGYERKWKRSRRIMRHALLPWFMTIGNHELYSCGWPISLGYSRKHWSRYWWKDDSTYHSFSYGGKKFIFTDSSTYLYPKHHLKLLEADLKSAKDKSVFIFTHRPLAYHNSSMKVRYGPHRQYWHKYWVMGGMRYVGRNKAFWLTLKNHKKKLLAVFHGHYHAYRSYFVDGIPVYCTGGGGGALETKRDFHHYLVVRIRRNGIIVRVVRI